VLNLIDVFPATPTLTSLYNPDPTYPEFSTREVITSARSRVRLLRNHFRFALPLFGWAFDHTAVPAGTDVVVVTTTGFAHGVRTAPGTNRLVICHTPSRFLYLEEDYLGGPGWKVPVGWALRALRTALVGRDRKAAASAGRYSATTSEAQLRN